MSRDLFADADRLERVAAHDAGWLWDYLEHCPASDLVVWLFRLGYFPASNEEAKEMALAHARGLIGEQGLRPRGSVYRFFDGTGCLLYVGVTARGAARVAEHGGTDWWPDVASVTVEHFERKSQARSAESEAIKNEHPLHNVAGRALAKAGRGK